VPSLPDWVDPSRMDLFQLWRFLLAATCIVYTVTTTLRWLGAWLGYLSGPRRTTALARRYLAVQLLRLRLGRFRWELAGIMVGLAAFVFATWAHSWVY
jgi:hypothetical protein